MVDNLFYSTEGNFENFFDLLLKGFLLFLNFFFQAERRGEGETSWETWNEEGREEY